MIHLPSFDEMELHELRRVIEDFRFSVDVHTAFLARAEAELRHRKQEKKEGIFRNRQPVAKVDEPKPH